MQVILLGRSALLLTAARHLVDAGVRVVGVVTDEAYPEYGVGPDDYAKFAASVGAEFATARRAEEVERATAGLVAVGDPVVVSCNWRYKLPQRTLDLWHGRVLNLHLGNLPDYKGNATVNWAILDGLDHVDADVHLMVADLDAGDVLARHRITLGPDTYVGDVLAETEQVAGALYLRALQALDDGTAPVARGSSAGLRCYPRLPEDGRIDWSDSAEAVGRLVRASSRPYPGAFSHLGGRTVQIWRARPVPGAAVRAVPGQVLPAAPHDDRLRVVCGTGVLEIDELALDGVLVPPRSVARSLRARLTHQPDRSAETA